MFVSYLLIDYLRHIIVRVMKDTHRWQKSREKTWMCSFHFLLSLFGMKATTLLICGIFCRNHPQTGLLKCDQAERQCWLASELQDLGTSAKTISCKSWDQKPENFIRGKYLGFVGHGIYVATTRLCHCSTNTAIDSMSTSGRGCVPINLKFEFRLTFMCLEILPF